MRIYSRGEFLVATEETRKRHGSWLFSTGNKVTIKAKAYLESCPDVILGTAEVGYHEDWDGRGITTDQGVFYNFPKITEKHRLETKAIDEAAATAKANLAILREVPVRV